MSNYQNWVYTRNPFLLHAGRSLQKLYVVVTDHAAKLQFESHDTEIDRLFQQFAPVSGMFTSLYRTWRRSINDRVKLTLELDNLLEEFNATKFEDWDVQIRYHFRSDTPEYRQLMREGKAVFARGKKDLRISAIRNLALALNDYPQLATLHAEVQALATLLENKRKEQLSLKKLERNSIQTLREMRDTVCGQLFRNLSYLNYLYWNTPQRVTDFFHMELVRKLVTSKANSVNTLEEEESLLLDNEEETPISLEEFDEVFNPDFEADEEVDG